MIKLILFDLDGVLVDAVELHKQAFLQAVKEIGGFTITDDFHDIQLNGLPTRKKLSMLVSRGDISEADVDAISDKKQMLTRVLIEDTIKRDRKKRLMLDVLRADGYRIGCVTNSTRSNAEQLLTATDLWGAMECVISNEDVHCPKPHPEGYWKGMSEFGLLPEHTVIVEDSSKGLEAAQATGAHIWHVQGPHEVTWKNIAEVLKHASIDSDGR